ncbi:uncharacterized protein LOC141934996 [Strix aluco]|uniref:uncharacterized protein LOC141934996 n=1 Tax=Strix aluco TaxID=111821 RepID=UPI003DA29D5E
MCPWTWVPPSPWRRWRWQSLPFLARNGARAASACRDGNGESAAAKKFIRASNCFPVVVLKLFCGRRGPSPSLRLALPCAEEKLRAFSRGFETLPRRESAFSSAAVRLCPGSPPDAQPGSRWNCRQPHLSAPCVLPGLAPSFGSWRWGKIARRVSKASVVLRGYVTDLIYNEAFSELPPQAFPGEESSCRRSLPQRAGSESGFTGRAAATGVGLQPARGDDPSEQTHRLDAPPRPWWFWWLSGSLTPGGWGCAEPCRTIPGGEHSQAGLVDRPACAFVPTRGC